MGPYYRQAAAEGDKSEVKFLQTVFSQYCTRWPLNTKDLSELDDMEGFMEAERKVSLHAHLCTTALTRVSRLGLEQVSQGLGRPICV